MRRFTSENKGAMAGFQSEKLVTHAHEDTLTAELAAAVEYAAAMVTKSPWMIPVGKAAKVSTPLEITARMTGEHAASCALFGGVLGYLDLKDRVKPMDELGVGRMCWGAANWTRAGPSTLY